MESKKITYIALGVIFFFTMLSQCNSRSANYNSEQANSKLDSALTIINRIEENKVNTKDLRIMLKIEGLKTEKSTLLNTNQIFLTSKRPDARVIEIDKELERLENIK